MLPHEKVHHSSEQKADLNFFIEENKTKFRMNSFKNPIYEYLLD